MKVNATFREYEHGGTKGFVDYKINGTIGIKGAALMEGEHGMFVNMPSIRVRDEYRDIVTGVSGEFRDLLLEAALAARDSENHFASIGEFTKMYFEPHVTALSDKGQKTKALASLTVRDHEGAEKSAFSISNIRIMEGKEGRLFVSMPREKTDNPAFPYHDICTLDNKGGKFAEHLLMHDAKKALGIDKKPSLDKAIASAATEKNSAIAKEPNMKEHLSERMESMR